MGFHCNGRLWTIFAGSHTAIEETGPLKKIKEMFSDFLTKLKRVRRFRKHILKMRSGEADQSSPSDEVQGSRPLASQNITSGNLERARVSSGIT